MISPFSLEVALRKMRLSLARVDPAWALGKGRRRDI
jgi:hypothetical protein